MRRALVLLSGGLDSAVALWWTMREGYEAIALSYHYPGRPRGEVRATDELVLAAACRHVEAELPFLREAADADRDAGTARFAGAPPGYIPGRNALYYAAACHQAQVLGCEAVVGGHNGEDAARYPDANEAFFRDLEALLAKGLWSGAATPPPRLLMPLTRLDRDGVAAEAARLGVPVQLTWSCYEDGDVPCGACPACARRGPLAGDVRPLSVAPARPRPRPTR